MRAYCPLVLIIIVADGNLLTVSVIDNIIIPLPNATSSIADAGQELPIQDENKLSDDDRNGEERGFESVHRIAQKGASWLQRTVPLTTRARTERQLFKEWKLQLSKVTIKPGRGTVKENIAGLEIFKQKKNDELLIMFFHWLRSSRKHHGDYLQKLFFEKNEGCYTKELIGVWLKAGMKPKEVKDVVGQWKGGDSLSMIFDELYKIKEADPAFSVKKTLQHFDDSATFAKWYNSLRAEMKQLGKMQKEHSEQ